MIMRIIFLVDMDYFYVACEEIRRPEIRGKPAVVGSDPKGGKGRGVVMTCNYPARKFGLHSGMPISMAYRMKPDAIYLPVDFDYYDAVSKKVMDLARSFADRFEQVSVDEAYLDVSKKVKDYEGALEYAKLIKDEVRERIGLPCSVGIGTSKLIAKMACEKAKPDGIKLVKEEESKGFIAPMKIGDLYGVGRKTREQLEHLGYKTVGDLAKANPMDMMDRFGTYGVLLHKYANGIDESDIIENYTVMSIGRELTFDADTDRSEDAVAAIRKLSNEVIGEVNKAGMSFKTITIKLRYSDFSEHLKSRSIKNSNNVNDIINVATELYFRNFEKGRKLRKIGVRVSNLIKYRGQKKIGEFS
ncbi:MAG: DNA polymerase IV [Candidatus Micrarchaeota archaeon]|nr:DNA polymerase IV [Candidatus Micrarchaeota archaeon]